MNSMDASPPSSTSPRPKRGCLKLLLGISVIFLAGLAFFLFVLVPLFRPPVDDSIQRPVIGKGKNTDPNGQAVGELRGSITDYLVEGQHEDAEHPLDPVLEVARRGLERIRTEIKDYTALMVKQERVGGALVPEEYMECKIRHARTESGESVPRGVYLKFVKPADKAGQEAIWVDGQNDGKLIGHAAGLLNLVRVPLEPTGMVAMRGCRYPITEAGIEVLLVRMIEKGTRDRQHDECLVEIDRDLTINEHLGTLITITHPEKRPHFEFHIAKIYIDDELNIPVGYEGYTWPEDPAGEPVLEERYFYQNVELNVGLTDQDFDPDNPDYDYP